MRFRDKELKGTPVVTLSGSALGKIDGTVMESDTHMIEQYVVRKSTTLSKLMASSELLVHRDQVISLTAERMVVQDAVVAEKEMEAVVQPKEQPAHGVSASTATVLERTGE